MMMVQNRILSSALVIQSYVQVLIQQCVYVSRGKVIFKDLLFVTRNGIGMSHTWWWYSGIPSIRNARVGSIFKTLLLDVDFIVVFDYSNCLYRIPHCISTLEIITRQSMCSSVNKLKVSICLKLSAHRAAKLLAPLLSMVFTS